MVPPKVYEGVVYHKYSPYTGMVEVLSLVDKGKQLERDYDAGNTIVMHSFDNSNTPQYPLSKNAIRVHHPA